jgi:cardiolipin synthase
MPFIVYAILTGNCRRAVVLVFLAGASDGFDGLLARRFNWRSRAGAYLDPIADKLLLTAVYLSLGLAQKIPGWLVWLVIGRDLLILSMAGAALLFTGFRDFQPSLAGKASTALQILTAIVALAACGNFFIVNHAAEQGLIWTTAAATLFSGIDYTVRALRMAIMRRTFLPAERRSPRG